MATALDSSTSSPATAPFHNDPFLSFVDGGAPAADVHVSGGGDDFLASPDPYAFHHDFTVAHPFGMPNSNGNGMHHEDDDDLFTEPGPVLPDPAQMGADDGILLRKWRRYVSFTSSPLPLPRYDLVGRLVPLDLATRSWQAGSFRA
ncbi:hypothetical protein ZWY2020_038100 [Hordeum vulgare]|nr:hypothetical protein ZWY2020_038100 [Hordeum vulgare]